MRCDAMNRVGRSHPNFLPLSRHQPYRDQAPLWLSPLPIRVSFTFYYHQLSLPMQERTCEYFGALSPARLFFWGGGALLSLPA
jgi:hypothetical protein